MNDQTPMNDTTERNTRMTPKQLRSAAHALRTAANALEEVTAQLRTLSTEIDTPDDPAWPTAKHVWWEDEMWTRDEAGDYSSVPDTGGGSTLSGVASQTSTRVRTPSPAMRSPS